MKQVAYESPELNILWFEAEPILTYSAEIDPPGFDGGVDEDW